MAAALTAAAAAVIGFAAIFFLLHNTQTLCCHSNQKQRSERCRGVLGLIFYTIAETVYFYCALVPWLSTASPALKELVLLINQPCLILVFLMMYLVVWSDPGLVRQLPLDSRGGADAQTCSVCAELRPPFSHHCRTCGACVADFDHHCHVLGVCIGRGNRPFFIGLLAIGATPQFMQLWGTVVSAYFEYYASPPVTAWMVFNYGAPVLAFLTVSCGMGLFTTMQTCLYVLGMSQHKNLEQMHRKCPLLCPEPEHSSQPPDSSSEGDRPSYSDKALPSGSDDDDQEHGAEVSLVPPHAPQMQPPVLQLFEAFCARVIPEHAAHRRPIHAAVVSWVAIGGCVVETRLAPLAPNMLIMWLLLFCAIVSGVCCFQLNKSQSAQMQLDQGEDVVGFCDQCQHQQLALMAHCSVCSQCVAGRSHHCSYFGTCIGNTNRRYYVALCVCGVGGIVPQLMRIVYYLCTDAVHDTVTVLRPVVGGATQQDEDQMSLLVWSAVHVLRHFLSLPIQFVYVYSVSMLLMGSGFLLWQQSIWSLYAAGKLNDNHQLVAWHCGKKGWGLLFAPSHPSFIITNRTNE